MAASTPTNALTITMAAGGSVRLIRALAGLRAHLTGLLVIIGVLALGAPASAQILAVRVDEKAQKKLKDYLGEFRGHPVVFGEAHTGLNIGEGGAISYNPAGTIELCVLDPKDPGETPWVEKKGKRQPAGKRNVVAFTGSSIVKIDLALPDETLLGLAREYRLRDSQMQLLLDARDEAQRGSADWKQRQERYLGAGRRFAQWLRSVGMPKAAKDLEKAVGKEERRGREEALAARGKAAEDSFRKAEPDPQLVQVLTGLGIDADRIQCFETVHLRVTTTPALLPPEDLEAALRFGEQAIELFRKELLDPYEAEDFPDRIPDKVFAEWILVPFRDEMFRGVSEQYMGSNWSRDVEARQRIGGERRDGTQEKPFRFLRKWREDDRFIPMVAHQAGHAIAGLHYGNEQGRMGQDWLSEAVAWWLSFELLGRNDMTCIEFRYDKNATQSKQRRVGEKGEKSFDMGLRAKLNSVALAQGRPVEQLAIKTLFEMDDADVAKSWSFYDYLVRREGEQAQRWLRLAGALSLERSSFIAAWREAATELLGVGPGKSLRVLDERWRDWALDMQDTSDDPRRKR